MFSISFYATALVLISWANWPGSLSTPVSENRPEYGGSSLAASNRRFEVPFTTSNSNGNGGTFLSERYPQGSFGDFDLRGKIQTKGQNAHAMPPSPANLLKPDGFHFYTYNEQGDMVTKRMTAEEIQALIAAGGPDHGTVEIHEPQQAEDILTGNKKVMDVVQRVQNVLKSALGKPVTPASGSVSSIPDQVNEEWTNILPVILAGDTDPHIVSVDTDEYRPMATFATPPATTQIPTTWSTSNQSEANLSLESTTSNGTVGASSQLNGNAGAVQTNEKIPVTQEQSSGSNEPEDAGGKTESSLTSTSFYSEKPMIPVAVITTEQSSASGMERVNITTQSPVLHEYTELVMLQVSCGDGCATTTTESSGMTPESASNDTVSLPPQQTLDHSTSTFTTTGGLPSTSPSPSNSSVPSIIPVETSEFESSLTNNTSDNEWVRLKDTPRVTTTPESITIRTDSTTYAPIEYPSYAPVALSTIETPATMPPLDMSSNYSESTSSPSSTLITSSSQSVVMESSDALVTTKTSDPDFRKSTPQSTTQSTPQSTSTFISTSTSISTSASTSPSTLSIENTTKLPVTISDKLSSRTPEEPTETEETSTEETSVPNIVRHSTADAELTTIRNTPLTDILPQAEISTSPSYDLDSTIQTTTISPSTSEDLKTDQTTVAPLSTYPTEETNPISDPVAMIESILRDAVTEATVKIHSTDNLQLSLSTANRENVPTQILASSLIAGLPMTENRTSDAEVQRTEETSTIVSPSDTASTISPTTVTLDAESTTQALREQDIVSTTPDQSAESSTSESTSASLSEDTTSYVTSTDSQKVTTTEEAEKSTIAEQEHTGSDGTFNGTTSFSKPVTSTESAITKSPLAAAENVTEREPLTRLEYDGVTNATEPLSAPTSSTVDQLKVNPTKASPLKPSSEATDFTSSSTELTSSSVSNESYTTGDLTTVSMTKEQTETYGEPSQSTTHKHEFKITETNDEPTTPSTGHTSAGATQATVMSTEKTVGSGEKWQLIAPQIASSQVVPQEQPANSTDTEWTRPWSTTSAAVDTTTQTTTTEHTSFGSRPTESSSALKPLEDAQSAAGLDTSTRNTSADIVTFSRLCNDLAFKYWVAANKGLSTGRSLALSPFGMTSLLAMIYLGARGTTSEQMNELLGLDNVTTFNPHLIFQNVTDTVSLVGRYHGVANAAFVRELFADKVKVRKLMPFYKEQAQQFYDGLVTEVNFATISDLARRRTNLLVRKQTGGRIKDFVRSNAVPLRSPLAAISANVFQSDCNTSVTSTSGRDGELYFAVSPAMRLRKLVPVPATVWRTGVLAGYEPSLDATVVALGNRRKLISTIFLLPGQQGHVAPGDSLDRLEQRLLANNGPSAQESWDKLLKVLVPRAGLELQLPKFSHRSLVNATAALKRMGFEQLFSRQADLKGINGISNRLYLSDVLQMNLFSTCGDENTSNGRHHVETYPASNTRRNSARTARFRFLRSPESSNNPLTRTYINVPQAAGANSEKTIEKPRLKLDQPFLYFVRHNPTGMILHMGRFSPRLLS